MRRTILTLLVVSAIAFSCKSPYENEVAQLDDLLVRLKTARTMLRNIDTSKIHTYKLESAANLKEIQRLTDTLDRNSGVFLNNYHKNKKAFMRVEPRLITYFDQIEVTIQQVEDLRTDLDKGLPDQEHANKFFQTEQRNGEIMIEVIYDVSSKLETIIPDFESQRSRMDHLLDSLKERNS